jgi:hypothetical protein
LSRTRLLFHSWPYRGIRAISGLREDAARHLIYVGMLPNRGAIGIFIWVVVGFGVIVFRLSERPKKTDSGTLDVGTIRGLLQRKFRKKAEQKLRANAPL